MTRFEDFYAKKEQEALVNNYTDLRNNMVKINLSLMRGETVSGAYVEKINNALPSLEGYTFAEIVAILASVPVERSELSRHQDAYHLVRRFEINPTKQNISEIAQQECLKSKGYNVISLKVNGTGSFRFFEKDNGEVLLVEDSKKASLKKCCKSFDCRVEDDFIIQKHTRASGGAQDNQYQDAEMAIRFAIRYCQQNPNCTKTFTAILDGDYYTQQKLSQLQQLIPASISHRVRITNTNEYQK
jgi:hypothetical protein